MQKEVAVAWIRVLSQNLSRENEEYHKNPSPVSAAVKIWTRHLPNTCPASSS